MQTVSDFFGCHVFSESVMKQKLPKEVFKDVYAAIHEGKRLDLAAANVVANSMKDWAIELGATHFTHWFQPMTGITAEKHDSFISPTADGGVIMEFSGKELIQGEPDASSFPSGGLRATFEARGYTAWDPTSFAFIKDHVLYIPTAFCSYGGEALDKKTPLLRSMQAINKQGLRILKLFGHTSVKAVRTTVGPEQEYFLIDEALYNKRKDLLYTGRTLFGSKPPKGQELDDHYFGTIKPRVAAFMQDLDKELWELGVLAKTEHNEVAPAQHELAPVFTTTNISADHNQLTMELMQKIARKHGMVCLLHEKPFAGVNGSGKHNNWSISTDAGVNLLEPGETPSENAQFLLFLCAVIQAVDDYQDLLRISVASAGNDHRLGANEAPPAVVSMFLGTELTEILDAIESDTAYDAKEKELLKIGVHVLPKFPKDTTDRNRTSPFAFTGNKFEFRMCGSQQNLSDPNVVLNTAVAEECDEFATLMDGKEGDEFTAAALEWVKKTLRDHHRIIFEGNGYSEEWEQEAARRGLPNFKTTPDALPQMIKPENIEFFSKYGVLNEAEVHARYVSKAEQYAKLLNIEANTMVDMAKRMYLPAISEYSSSLAGSVATKAELGLEARAERELVTELTGGIDAIYDAVADLEAKNSDARGIEDPQEECDAYRDSVLPAMDVLRAAVDEMETIVADDYWPVPSYNSMLFWV